MVASPARRLRRSLLSQIHSRQQQAPPPTSFWTNAFLHLPLHDTRSDAWDGRFVARGWKCGGDRGRACYCPPNPKVTVKAADCVRPKSYCPCLKVMPSVTTREIWRATPISQK